jgi:endonuclease/exonuclease/phosphatase family metal-dependent hydrolase
MADLRLLSYNIRSLRDDPMAVAAVIRACEPDVVCVQEAPRFLRWRSKRAALAREAGMVVATADRVGGLLVLAAVRTPVLGGSFRALSKAPKLHQRVLATADVEVGGAPLRVGTIHLSLDDDERLRHIDEIWAALPDDGMPLVLAGDVNALPGEPAWTALTDHLVDAAAVAPTDDINTYSARRPHKRIDGVFVDPRITVVSCGVPDVPGVAQASDHRPVLAELELSYGGTTS